MYKILQTLAFIIFYSSFAICQSKISVITNPQNVFVEMGEHKKYLNLDFVIKNNTSDTFTLSKIVANVLDKQNHIIHQRFLDNNGTAPGIQIIPNRVFAAFDTKLIFNPFSEYNLGISLNKIQFEFTFSSEHNEEFIVKTEIQPIKYTQKIIYTFPLNGKILVYDAHDFYSHHRRFDYEFVPIKQLGIRTNFMRYAYDFVLLDSANKSFTGENDNAENYFGYAKDVSAVADGRIIYASNKHKDNKTFDIPEIANNPLELYGNCVAIQHKDSSISIYGHLKQNSIKVKLGDFVRAKQPIASIGISGSSFFPHLHFEIRTSLKHSAEGLPSYFSNVLVFESGKYVRLKSGLVETGSVITTR